MRGSRGRVACLALAICAGSAGSAFSAVRGVSDSGSPLGRWRLTSDMRLPRTEHAAVRLSDGRVLVTGGWSISGGVWMGAIASAELYDPAEGAWSEAASMNTPRSNHEAILLPDGRAIVVGGLGGAPETTPLASVEIFDPVTGTWSETKPMDVPRWDGTVSVLMDGTLLVVGGTDKRRRSMQEPTLRSVERFDPATGNWIPTEDMTERRDGHSATVLADGRVLVAGGEDGLTGHASAEIFDPASGSWSPVSPMARSRRHHVGVLLPSGGVLVGGDPSQQLMARATSPAEIFDSASGAWRAAASMGEVPYFAQAVVLADGQVLFAGGHRAEGPRPSGVYDPAVDAWTPVDRPILAACGATLTALAGGGALMAGGGCSSSLTAQAQVFDPAAAPTATDHRSGEWRTLPDSRVPHEAGVFMVLSSGELLAAGGTDWSRADVLHGEVEVFDVDKVAWHDAPPMSVPRKVAYTGELRDGRVIAAGGITAVGAPNTVTVTTDLRDPESGSWSLGPDMSVPRQLAFSGVLADGRFLVAGGVLTDPASIAPWQFLRTAEVFDPLTDRWSEVAGMIEPRGGAVATPLLDGRFLVVGGIDGLDPEHYLRSAEVYDPATDVWLPAGQMSETHVNPAIALLDDGRVLVVGGRIGGGEPTGRAEIFDPETLAWSSTGDLLMPRSEALIGTLWTGEVLVAGGSTVSSRLDSTEIYDPATGSWRAAARMEFARSYLGVAVSGHRVFVGSDPFGEVRTTEQFVYEPNPPRLVAPLDGPWRFQKGEQPGVELAAFDDSSWEVVDVPHTWNALDGQDGGDDYYRGPAWYWTSFTAPDQPSARKWFIDFRGANSLADVWLNGVHLGSHAGGYTRFRVEASGAVLAGENLLAVRVSNAPTESVAPLVGDYTMFGGLYRSVELVSTEWLHVRLLDHGGPGVVVRQDHVSAETADLSVTVKLWNTFPESRVARVRASVRDAEGVEVAAVTNEQAIAPDSGADVSQSLQLLEPHLWDGRADPYLYTLSVEVWDGATLRDEVTQTLGIRTVAADPDHGFFLNGRKLPLRGVSRHQDRQDMGWALRPEHHAEDMALIAEMGANAVRLAHYPQDELVYDLADRLGLIVWSEVPLINGVGAAPDFADNARTQMTEMIRQNMHHPSVAIWGVGNEVTQDRDRPDPDALIASIADLVQTEDPSRISAIAHCCTADDGPTVHHTTLVGYNKYFGWYGGSIEELGQWADRLHAAEPGLAFGISEYGAGASILEHQDLPSGAVSWSPDHSEEYQALLHERAWSQIAARPYLVGSFVWNMFDFASDGRNEGDTAGRNDKGLVSYDRREKKDAFWFYKSVWSEDPVVHISGGDSRTVRHDYVDVKVYSNADSVELLVNGVSQDERESGDGIYRWVGVRLGDGANQIAAMGSFGAATLQATSTWTLAPGHSLSLPAVWSD